MVLTATNVVYLFLGSAEVQPWNNPNDLENENEKKKRVNGSTTGKENNVDSNKLKTIL